MSIFDRPGLHYISHRGFRPLAPDNSLPGFEYAGILKQWAIETDVHMSADGVLMCNHNTTVDASYDGNGVIWEMFDICRELVWITSPPTACMNKEELC